MSSPNANYAVTTMMAAEIAVTIRAALMRIYIAIFSYLQKKRIMPLIQFFYYYPSFLSVIFFIMMINFSKNICTKIAQLN